MRLPLSMLAAILLLGTSAAAVAEGELPAAPLDRSFIVGVVGEPKGAPLVGEELERRTHEVGLLLRCPVCQGSAVSDSPSPTAINMKNEVRDLLRQGFDTQQILAWFEASYGQFVLMEPKAEGINLMVWLGPGIMLVGGLIFLLVQLRKPDPAALAEEGVGIDARIDEAPLPDDPELAASLREIRELAYGDGDPSTKRRP